MSLQVADRSISKILTLDDDSEIRETYSYIIEDLDLEPVPIEGPLPGIDQTIQMMQSRGQAAICDHRMKVHKYASFNGAELVAHCFDAGFPAVLVTRFEDADLDEIRRLRQRIPALLKPGDIKDDPSIIGRAVRYFLEELHGDVAPSRKPRRTLVWVSDVDDNRGFFHVIVPAWSMDEGLRLRLDDVPPDVRDTIRADAELHSMVNIGADTQEELFFCDWEKI